MTGFVNPSLPDERRPLSDAEQTHCDAILALQKAILKAAMGQGHRTVTLSLDVFVWWGILDEIVDRRPRNFSAVFRDDTMERLHAAIDRLHGEANYLIAAGPSQSVADRFRDAEDFVHGGNRTPRPKRSSIDPSPELSRKMRDLPREREPGEDG